MLHDLEAAGFIVIERVIDSSTTTGLIEAVRAATSNAGPAPMHAMRNLLTTVPQMRRMSDSPEVRRIVEPVLGAGAFVVRGILFDKTPDANWKVAWHQDLSIAVERRVDVAGFGPWSVKAGVQHVQPPVEILRQMLTVRIHLDDCGVANGPLRVLPGSHSGGILSPDAIEIWRANAEAVDCCVHAGGAVVMRPLILHASSPAKSPSHRRVIHLEFASGQLPGGLEWHEQS